MVELSGRARMISSVNNITGNDNCSEAVVIAHRPAWVTPTTFGIAFVTYLLLLLAGVPLMAAGAISLVLGLSVPSYATMRFILARTGDNVVLSRSNWWSARAVSIEWSTTAPVQAQWGGGLLNKELTVAQTNYVVARMSVGRVKAVLG